MGMGGPSNTTTTQKQQPWSGAVPTMQQYLADLNILANPFANRQLPTQSVAPFTPMQQQGFGAIPGEAGQAAQIGGAGANTAMDILGGRYLSPSSNPYLRQYYEAAAAPMVNQYQMATSPDITAQAVQQGGLGGSGQNQSQQYAKWGLGQNLSNLAAGIYEPAYAQGLNQMTATLGMTPQLAAGAFTPSQGLLAGGAQQQALQQQQRDTAYRNALAQFNLPYQMLGTLGQGAGMMAGQGGTSITTAPNTLGTVK